jgi:hypothetical protein
MSPPHEGGASWNDSVESRALLRKAKSERDSAHEFDEIFGEVVETAEKGRC